VAPSRAPPCALQAIGCCEHWAGLTAEEVLEEALTVAASVEVAPAVLVAAAAASEVVAPAVEAVTWAV
jgi:alkylhydroperoxidase/carboxymuconolactone decarboxylase family protein YurZ